MNKQSNKEYIQVENHNQHLVSDTPTWEQRVDEAEKTYNDLASASQEFYTKYSEEVKEGTRKKQLLIENGRKEGKTDKEIDAVMFSEFKGFVPSEDTPILNLLHFLDKEHPDVSNRIKVLREEMDGNKDFETLYVEHNTKYGSLSHEEIKPNIPDVFQYLNSKATLDIFEKIKKLKTLAMNNPNSEEAVSAMEKAGTLCELYGLDYDRIPVNI